MKINNKSQTSIWYEDGRVFYIDQTKLPWDLKIRELGSLKDAIRAIENMEVRGAPLIGVAAAFGIWLAAKEGKNLVKAAKRLLETRPTAVNLSWAVEKMLSTITGELASPEHMLLTALNIRQEEIESSYNIGKHGLPIIEQIKIKKKSKTVNILTHCNAGWLACVDWGTALAPIYMAHDNGLPVHVWVDETRPRNQGARLTAYELGAHGVPYTLIPDNTGGHLMQNGLVDVIIVGADRVAANGDAANKIGTYLKALAAKDNNLPFYVAIPYSSFDANTPSGKDIPIEERDPHEILTMQGKKVSGTWQKNSLQSIYIVDPGTPVANYGFDITPARLVSGYITDIGLTRYPFGN